MKRFFNFLFLPIFASLLIALLLVMSLLTPDRTNRGQYTNPFKYWFDNEYYQTEFVK